MLSPALQVPSSRGGLACARSRGGLSVIELLAATVISLIVMGATVQLFGTVGNEITNGRSNIEAGDRLRGALERLRKDLRGITVDLRTWNRPEDASGYFEIVKGPRSSWDKSVASPSLVGYTADGLFFTTRTRDVPFVGRVMMNAAAGSPTVSMVESQVAEVAWFLQPTNVNAVNPGQTAVSTSPPTYTLYRRVMLVLPGISSTIASGAPASPASIPQNLFYSSSSNTPLYDLSAHLSGNNWLLNSLADLAYRECRFAHSSTYPYQINTNLVQGFPYSSSDPYMRYGEDVVLTNVLSFDVKVWDPGAPVLQDKSLNPLVPSDRGYPANPQSPPTGITPIGTAGVYGAYVDLNWNGSPLTNPTGAPPSYFAGPYYQSGQNSPLAPTTTTTAATYDTWPAGYETWNNGPNGSSSGRSNNGFDDTGSGVDSPVDRITSPPYPAPLRGIQIKVRTYEFTSKQVREATIQESFVPD